MNGIQKWPHTQSGVTLDGPAERGYFSVSQAAALLGVNRVSVWRWIRAGRLPAARLVHRTIRIRGDDIERALIQIGASESEPGLVQASGAAAKVKGLGNGKHTRRSIRGKISAYDHFVQFYETDAFLLSSLKNFVSTGLAAGDASIVIATGPHRAGLEERLRADGLDVATARTDDQYISLDATEMLPTVMVDGAPEARRFAEVVASIIARAAKGQRRVRIFGELVALLGMDGNYPAAVRLEAFWNDLQKAHPFTLLCAYPMDLFGGEALAEMFGDVCAEHSHVIPAESYAELTSPDERLRAITRLQQQAGSLEAEIAERKRVDQERIQLLASERVAREEAEAAVRLRDEFLSIAAHELRTPLTTLSGHAQLVLRRLKRDGQLDAERVVPSLQAITGQADKLSRLLTQLLDISRLDAGKLTLEPQLADLATVVEQAVAGARTRSDRHAISLEAPPSVLAEVDPLRLEQVLVNLLDNAIKYSPNEGPIEVALSRPTHSTIELSVRDHGLGIPPEKRAHIFERFYQAHGNGYKSGMGLGLYISRQIVELHGGELAVEFPPDGGTRFVVRLPREIPRQVDAE
jgi:excisionase family DNA binding protein